MIMGLFSSLHCLGMCGPLALALPLQQYAPWQRLISVLLYHTGRLLTYSLLGLAFGLAGRRLSIAGWQQGFSILMGILILLTGLFTLLKRRPFRMPITDHIQARITQLNMYLWRAPQKCGFLFMGMGNGLLPCGMVYVAIAAALSTGDAFYSSMFMLFFGLGTLPALAGLGYWGYRLNAAVRRNLQKLVPVFVMTMGLVLVLRGLDLQIPFISPVLPVLPGNAASCH